MYEKEELDAKKKELEDLTKRLEIKSEDLLKMKKREEEILSKFRFA